MQDVFSLIQCLTSREWESLRSYLTCFSTHANDEGGPKQLQLAKILREASEEPEQSRCCVLIYGIKDEQAFEMLKSRLKEKTLDFLLTDISCDKKQELDEADLAFIKMKKKSAQFQQLFYSKKRTPFLHYMLDEIIALAKDYEQYFILAEHLKAKKNMVSWKKGELEFNSINKEIEYYSRCSDLYIKSENYYYKLIMQYEYGGKPDKQKIDSFLKKAITELHEENKDIKSPTVNYHLKNLEMDFYQLRGDYAKARSICLELLDVVRKNKSVYRRQRVGIVYDHLSRCEYYLGKFEQAVKDAQEAQQNFNAGSENFCIALEQEFYALFALEKYEEAIAVAEKMISSASRKELGEFRHAKYNYLLANALFKLRRFTEALNILSQDWELSNDKAGWDVGLRTLKIMTLLEMRKHNEAELAVLNMKQFFKRLGKTSTVNTRDRMIHNLLMQVYRAGFAFNMLNGTTEKNLSMLSSDKQVKWEPFTHEVILFHDWFAEKMGKKKLVARQPKPIKAIPLKEKKEKVLVRK